MVDRHDDRSEMTLGKPLEEASVEEFAAGFRGELIRPEDDGYDAARKVYNGMIDKRPALIVRPTGAADVIDAVNLARENGLPLAVRCGGRSVAGKGVVDGGVLINLSSLKGVRVDPKARRRLPQLRSRRGGRAGALATAPRSTRGSWHSRTSGTPRASSVSTRI